MQESVSDFLRGSSYLSSNISDDEEAKGERKCVFI